MVAAADSESITGEGPSLDRPVFQQTARGWLSRVFEVRGTGDVPTELRRDAFRLRPASASSVTRRFGRNTPLVSLSELEPAAAGPSTAHGCYATDAGGRTRLFAVIAITLRVQSGAAIRNPGRDVAITVVPRPSVAFKLDLGDRTRFGGRYR
jgi:hypothetical protein